MKNRHFIKSILGCIFIPLMTLMMISFASGANPTIYGEYGNVSDHRFYYPEEIDVDANGIIYVADAYNHAIKAFKETGQNLFSIANGSGDGAAQFNYPTGVARDMDGKIWVVDHNNHRLQRFTGSGGFEAPTFGEYVNSSSYRLDYPHDMVVGPDGNYWIADYNNDRVVVITPQGKQVKVIGTKKDSADTGEFNGPTGLDFDKDDNLWVVDHNNHRVQKFDSSGKYAAKIGELGASSNSTIDAPYFVRPISDGVLVSYGNKVTKFSLNGLVVFTLGKLDGSSGSGNGEFNNPRGITVDSSGNIYVADYNNSRIQKFTKDGVPILPPFGGYTGGAHSYASAFDPGDIYRPQDIEMDNDGIHLWIMDEYYDVVQKFTTAGVYVSGFDGSSDTAGGKFNSPNGLNIDAQGNLWISDDGKKRVRQFKNDGAYIKTVSVFTINGQNDELTTNVGDIVVDGNYLWVADWDNDRLLKIDVTNNTGTAFSGFNNPLGLARDTAGNLWIADYYQYRIVQMNTSGLVMRAFSETSSYDQKLSHPTGVVTDSTGAIWVSDRDNDRVLRYTGDGTLTHKIGGYNSRIFKNPRGIAMASDGSLWVADNEADAVLHFSSDGVCLGRIDNTTQDKVTLDYVTGVATYKDANDIEYVLLCDTGKHQVVKFKTDGTYVGNMGESGYGNDLNKYYNPEGLRVSGQEILVADAYNGRIKVLSIEDGAYKRAYTTDGGDWGKFSHPVGIAVNKTSGSIWVTDRDNDRLHELRKNTQGQWEFFRAVGGPYNGLFWNPHNIYIDKDGYVWVSDNDKDTVIKLDSEGNLVKILGDGQQSGGSFNYPSFALGQADGSMWVTDTNNHRVVHLDSSGNLLALIGKSGTGNGQFKNPEGVAVSGSNVYVADTANDRIQKFSFTGDFLGIIGSAGKAPGYLDDPAGIIFDTQNRLWVVERANNRLQAFNVDGQAQFTVGSSLIFNNPFGIAIDLNGNLWVTDTNNHRVHKFPSNVDDQTPPLLTLGKAGKVSGNGAGEFNSPHGVAVDSKGYVHVADTSNNRVQVFDTNGNFIHAYGDLSYPRGISIAGGKVYVADRNNKRIAIFNEGGAFLSAIEDNGGAETGFNNPRGISMDSGGNLWVADSDNDRVVKIDPDDGTIIKKVTEWLNGPIGVQVDGSDYAFFYNFLLPLKIRGTACMKTFNYMSRSFCKSMK